MLPWMHPARVAALEDALARRILVIDGAMGTMIQRHELQEADYRGERFAEGYDRLFAADERTRNGAELSARSLAGRFAAKEALIKALGDSWAMRWHDMAVVGDEHGKPSMALAGAASEAAEALGVRRVHVSMSHDAGMAIAMVIAED